MNKLSIDYNKIVNQLPLFAVIENFYNGNTKRYRAIFDTGAMKSAISPSVFDELACTETGIAFVNGVGGKIVTPKTIVNISLTDEIKFIGIDVTVSDFGKRIDALLGMDIITRGNFHIDNHTDTADKTVLTFAT